MNKLIVVALALLAVAYAQPYNYAGTTSGGNGWYLPTWDSSMVCSTGTQNASYVMFNINVTSAEVFNIQAMAEDDFKSSLTVFVYTSFNSTTPCSGFLFQPKDSFGLSGGPVINDFLHLTTGVYTVVVTSSSGVSGIFAINIMASTARGQTTEAGAHWMVPDYDGQSCSNGTEMSTVGTFTWTQASTMQADLLVYFYNATYNTSYGDWQTTLALYNGSYNSTQVAGNPCMASIIGAVTSGSEEMVAFRFNATLMQGWNYTLAFSGGAPQQVGYYGVLVRPTIAVSFKTSTPYYTQPDRTTPCAPASSSYADAGWYSYPFTAVGSAYLIDTQSLPSNQFTYLDTYSFMYEGLNVGNATVAPGTCTFPLVSYGDTGDVTPVFTFTTPGMNYTVIVSTYGGSHNPGDFALYVMTGTPIGNIPVTTTGVTQATTGVAATGSAGTTGMDDDSSSNASVLAVVYVIMTVCALVAMF